MIFGTSGADTIDGAGGNDIICGFASEDHITGGTGDDRLFGGLDRHYEGDDSPYVGDLLVPGPGDDHVDLGVDLDSLKLCDCYTYMTPDRVSYADSTTGVKVNLTTGLATGEGRDTIVGDGHFGVIGSAFDDHLVGTDGPNDIEAGAGADTVDAGAGDDWVYLDAPPVRRELNGTTTDSTRPPITATPSTRAPETIASPSLAATASTVARGTMRCAARATHAGPSAAARGATRSFWPGPGPWQYAQAPTRTSSAPDTPDRDATSSTAAAAVATACA